MFNTRVWRLGWICSSILLFGVLGGWVDPDTIKDHYTTTSYHDGREFHIVMSDEFDKEGRDFEDGHDPKWTAVHKNDYTNAALHFYHKDMVRTHKGKLNITTVNEDIHFKYWNDLTKSFKSMHKVYQSGMLQSWNKFCFTGGILEVSASLPGSADVGGLWPAIWLLGNLARTTYTSSSDYMWPWSYDKCDRSTKERAAWQHQQEVSACDAATHYDFHPNQGRGAPEIDVLEAMAGQDPYSEYMVGKPYISQSFQVSPGTATNRPLLGSWPEPGMWYSEDLVYGKNTTINPYFYGTKLLHKPDVRSYWADAISANHRLTSSNFNRQHTYRLEWIPGDQGYIRWYIDGAFTFGLTAETLKFGESKIPDEPMYVLFNTAVSTMWGFPAPCPDWMCPCDCWDAREPKCRCALPDGMGDILPASFLIDWVRVYQAVNDSSMELGCNPQSHPTRKWIEGHAEQYKDPQDTHILLPLVSGGGACKTDKDCGGGTCGMFGCKCTDQWTGPSCRAPYGFNDYEWEEGNNRLPGPRKPIVPAILWVALLCLACSFLATGFVRRVHRHRRTLYSKLDNSGVTIPPLKPTTPRPTPHSNSFEMRDHSGSVDSVEHSLPWSADAHYGATSR